MRVLVTGSSGHLGEALMRRAAAYGVSATGIDIRPGPFTAVVADLCDRAALEKALRGMEGVLHAATLHKPHVATHAKQSFVDVNVSATLAVLEGAVAAGARRVVFTSTTSAFGDAMRPEPGAPAVWIDEGVAAQPRNIYGATKIAAEALCRIFHRDHGLRVPVLRTSRFFPEDDDDAAKRSGWSGENAKLNEFTHRRLDIEDAADAHFRALERAEAVSGRVLILSAPTPFLHEDLEALRTDAPSVAARRVPGLEAAYRAAGYHFFPSLDRVYDSSAAQAALNWTPRWTAARLIEDLAAGRPIGSDLAREVGAKGYHDRTFDEGPYPVSP